MLKSRMKPIKRQKWLSCIRIQFLKLNAQYSWLEAHNLSLAGLRMLNFSKNEYGANAVNFFTTCNF